MGTPPLVTIAIQVGSILFGFGASYGFVKSRLDDNKDTLTEILTMVKELDKDNRQSTIAEEKQFVINANLNEKIETLQDRVDVHAIAIKQMENELIQIKTTCDYHLKDSKK